MQLYQLKSKQVFPISKAEAWDFLSDPKNLAVITPQHMGFHILAGADRPMFQGQVIQYIVGPYSLWHHKHFLKEIPEGVEMEDVIDYKLPFGFLGKLAHPILVKKQLKKIFEFRENKLAELFGTVVGKENYLSIRKI